MREWQTWQKKHIQRGKKCLESYTIQCNSIAHNMCTKYAEMYNKREQKPVQDAIIQNKKVRLYTLKHRERFVHAHDA